jgi:CheY-specific phosphatase CheX
MDIAGLEAAVHTVMEEVLSGLLGTPPQANPQPRQARTQEARLACAVSIDGDWHGRVVVSATLGLAEQTATAMFGDDLPGLPTERDARDALREIANIVAGNLKPLFGDHNALGLPEDMNAASLQPLAAYSPLAHASVPHGDGVLEVSVYPAV